MQEKDPHLESFDSHVTVEKRNGRVIRYYHHSQSPAAWVGVIMAGLGFLLAAVGAMLGPMWILIYIGAALVVGSLIVGNILKAMGLGQG
ncbi:hypothetical protein M3G03_08015 [Aestuariimicrobium sp. p3-SID1156]|uniref:HGxxPAAW family protein n=1 Tax=Aestuariimicrobium sp. p3-SID1156 TaxID=2916038 RepID=UPI00223A8CAC|nr:HGxxPAAW family protein [Aestuariimicrobium sp. p3-SID1156]MCT1459485.1 hypothetical protein [Aestuariimicrobium sp. p3-SID1156]